MTLNAPSAVADEVRAAVEDARPVVALESTIITHGLPRPRNVEVALDAEAQLRADGVTPATVGVVDGTPVVGLDAGQIERLGLDDATTKASTRDLPIAAVRGTSAGTTVAATAYLAHRAGIKVFATGGLGGVHRDAAETFDESADLLALSSTPLLVVSAGVKSILDVGATLERLETLNVPVVGYRTHDFPGFYTARSGHRLEYAVDTPAEAADLARCRDALGLESGVLVANPVSSEDELDPALHDETLDEALRAAHAEGISGHDITPYLLDYLARATGGRSLEVNLAIYRANVRLGGQIALAMSRDREAPETRR